MSPNELLTEYRKRQQRATLAATASICLSIGLAAGFFLSGPANRNIVGARDLPEELSSSFVEVARQIEASVVNISTVAAGAGQQGGGNGIYSGERIETRRGVGSGVIVDESGFILTNHHVIGGADRIRVKLSDGTEYTAVRVGSDAETDLAVIKIDAKARLRAARLGDSDKTRVGDWVLAIGSPFGLDQTVTAGIISARDREATDLRNRPSYQYFLQTDAAINRGNSGGPLINLAGEVIGINSAIATSTGDYNGIGFALPSNEALAIYRQLKNRGRVVRGFLGVVTDPVTPQIAKVYGLAGARGAIVSIVPDTYELDGREIPTPAANAGLQVGDVLLAYRGELLRNNLDLTRRIAATPVGEEVELSLWRAGQILKVRTSIGRRPSSMDGASDDTQILSGETRAAKTLGIEIAPLPAASVRDAGTSNLRGVVVAKVDAASIAEDAELRRDDIIESVNRIPVATPLQFRRTMERLQPGDPVVMQVFRRRSSTPRRFVSFNMP